MEQRAPGHTVLGDVIYRKGLLDLKEDVRTALNRLDFFNDPEAYDKQQELKAMAIAADAVIRFAERHAEVAEQHGRCRRRSRRAVRNWSESPRCAAACRPTRRETSGKPCRSYWFIHLGVVTELNTWDSFNPGRLDQHLYPFYQRQLSDGSLTREQARELLQCFWVKFNNQPAPPKVGVTAAESGTYTDFATSTRAA